MTDRLGIPGSDLLAAALKARGLSYEEAAEKVGASDTFVSMLVNRQRAPGRKVALGLREAFGIPLDAPWPLRRQRRRPSSSLVHPPVGDGERSRDLGSRRRIDGGPRARSRSRSRRVVMARTLSHSRSES